ncbi:MAG: YncE family protein, partial [Chloroflexota bacterium]
AIDVGGQPSALTLSPDGVTAYVSQAGANTVAVVDTATGRVTDAIEVGAEPAGSALAPDGWLYVANAGANTLTVIDTATRRAVGSIPVGRRPVSVAIAADRSGFAYVANYGDNTVSVIDLATQTVAKVVPVGEGPVTVAAAVARPSGTVPVAGPTGPNAVPQDLPNTGGRAALPDVMWLALAVGVLGAGAFVRLRARRT